MVSFTPIFLASVGLASQALAQRTIQILAVQDLTLEDTFAFKPNSVNAAIGDTLEFHFAPTGFLPSNHSVAQGTFEEGCKPMPNGFWSGPMPTDPDPAPKDNAPARAVPGENDQVFRVTVTTANPMVFYCTAGQHCTRGMYGVVNPSNSQNLASYKSLITSYGPAEAPPLNISGGQLFPNPGAADPVAISFALKLPTVSAIGVIGAMGFAILLS